MADSKKTIPAPIKESNSKREEREEILVVAESLIEKYRIQIFVVTILFIVVVVSYFSYQQNMRVRTDAGWNKLSSSFQQNDPEEISIALRKLLEIEAKGTNVEPWVLWQLAHTYVSSSDYTNALETLETLQKKYPNHYLNTRREVEALEDSTPLAKAIAAVKDEKDFWQNWIEAEKKENPQAKILTSKGTLRFELFESHCPETVKMFVHLAENGFYDNLKFRDAFNGKIKSGSLMTDGKGNPGYKIRKEYSDERHGGIGALAMESSTEDEFDGKFYITTKEFSAVESKIDDQRNTVFGRLIPGENQDAYKLNFQTSSSRLDRLKNREEFKKLVDEKDEEKGKKLQEDILEALREINQDKVFLNKLEFETTLKQQFNESEVEVPKELFEAMVKEFSDSVLKSLEEGDIIFSIKISNKRAKTIYIPKKAQLPQK